MSAPLLFSVHYEKFLLVLRIELGTPGQRPSALPTKRSPPPHHFTEPDQVVMNLYSESD